MKKVILLMSLISSITSAQEFGAWGQRLDSGQAYEYNVPVPSYQRPSNHVPIDEVYNKPKTKCVSKYVPSAFGNGGEFVTECY